MARFHTRLHVLQILLRLPLAVAWVAVHRVEVHHLEVHQVRQHLGVVRAIASRLGLPVHALRREAPLNEADADGVVPVMRPQARHLTLHPLPRQLLPEPRVVV